MAGVAAALLDFKVLEMHRRAAIETTVVALLVAADLTNCEDTLNIFFFSSNKNKYI